MPFVGFYFPKIFLYEPRFHALPCQVVLLTMPATLSNVVLLGSVEQSADTKRCWQWLIFRLPKPWNDPLVDLIVRPIVLHICCIKSIWMYVQSSNCVGSRIINHFELSISNYFSPKHRYRHYIWGRFDRPEATLPLRKPRIHPFAPVMSSLVSVWQWFSLRPTHFAVHA